MSVEPDVKTDFSNVHVQLYYGKDAESYRLRYEQGREPDKTPYGFHLAEEEGFYVTFSRDGRRRLAARVIRKLCDFDVAHAYRNREAMARADIIWTMTEGEAFAAALLMRLGIIPKRPIISNAVWLLNRWRYLSWPRRRIYKALATDITVLTVHSERCLPVARSAFSNVRSELMYFGINLEHFPLTKPDAPRDSAQLHIVAAGNDRTRDWDTLISAFGGDDRFRVTLACSWLSPKKISRYNNITLSGASTATALRSLYKTADVIAVPMRENVFSGITVALEAAALGKTILATRTGGVPTYFDDDHVVYVAAGDPTAMREALLRTTPQSRRALAEAAQQRFLERDYSTRGLISRYAQLTRDLTAGS